MRAEMYEITGCPAGRIATMPRPRGGEWLKNEIISMRGAGVTDIVTLLTLPEEMELGLHLEQKLCEDAGIFLHRFPVVDRGVPGRENFDRFIAKLLPILRAGGFIAIHCRAGIGRSSVIAAGLLCGLGVPAPQALDMISRARGFDVPDTQQQFDFIMNLDYPAGPPAT
jgi:protein-tyrosine phosphatase